MILPTPSPFSLSHFDEDKFSELRSFGELGFILPLPSNTVSFRWGLGIADSGSAGKSIGPNGVQSYGTYTILWLRGSLVREVMGRDGPTGTCASYRIPET